MPAKRTKSQTVFHHHRLSSPRSIRILVLLPSQEFQTALEVNLTEVTLDNVSNDQDSYEALSYVWGSRSGTEPIRCDGKLLLVTPNCESALRHLRLKDTARTLWVDAICIDQENGAASIEERNTQVALMGEIYKKAVRTLCWFGAGNDFTDELMAHLERIGTCPSQRGLKKLLLFDEKLREEGRLDYDSSALNYIFCHSWHSRIWTVQEAAYSQDCEVVCGNSSIPWDAYSAAAHFLVFEEFIEQLHPDAHKSNIAIDVRNTIREYLRKPPSSNHNLSSEDEEDNRHREVVFLSSCLTDVNQLQATEPRDKIYGIHALYTDLGIPLPAVSYEKPLSRVYEEAAVAMVTWSSTLQVIGDACHNDRNTAFPSWVPDWSDENIKISTPSGNATRGSKIAKFSAKILNPRLGELHVQGKVVGAVLPWKDLSVTAVFPTRPENCELPILTQQLDGLIGEEEEVETLRLWIEITRFFRQFHSLLQANPDLCQEGLEDTLLDLVNQDSNSEPPEIFEIWLNILQYPETKYDLRLGEAVVEKWKVADESNAAHWTTELTNCAIIVASLLTNSVQHDGRVLSCASEILDLINRFHANLSDKTLIFAHLSFAGKTLTSLGTSFHSVTTGDSIVLLEGAQWPVALRQKGKKWQLTGPAFVTGIMNGEAWPNDTGQLSGMKNFFLV
ncbi:HET-domain-containing protein [Stipitochalara longipes BDJ]|nr:HET-domain-containing protein [Stipitochalara longipes BDJ]